MSLPGFCSTACKRLKTASIMESGVDRGGQRGCLFPGVMCLLGQFVRKPFSSIHTARFKVIYLPVMKNEKDVIKELREVRGWGRAAQAGKSRST